MPGRQLMKDHAASDVVPLSSLFWIFFRIACTSFGGFMAMISVLNNVIVERRKLLSSQDMLDGVSLASILPGTMAVNLVAYVGYRLRGAVGALVCASAAVLPALVFIVVLGIAYFRWGQLPAVSRIFMGFTPAVVGLIVVAAWNMGRTSVSGWREAVIAVAAAAILYGVGGFFSTIGIVVGAALLGWWWFREVPAADVVVSRRQERKSRRKRKPSSRMSTYAFLLAAMPGSVTPLAPLASFEPGLLIKIFVTFAGMNVLLFGGHYVFIPIIQEVVVNGHGWVTQQEFVDAVALGQITPGPLMVSAAFIGLKIAGLAGALVAALGIFTPSAILMVLCTRLLVSVKKSTLVAAALRGVRPAVVGMIAAAAVMVGKTMAPVWISAAILIATLITLLRFRIEAVWVLPVAGAIGYFVY